MIAVEDDGLVTKDVPVLGDFPFIDDRVIGIAFLSCHEEESVFRPPGKEGIIRRAPAAGQDGFLREGARLCHVDLVDVAFGDMGKDGKIAVVVQKKVELHCALRPAEGSPVKQSGAQVDHRGVQDEELVLEAKLLPRRDGPCLVEKLVEHLLIELPWALLVRIGERGPGGGMFSTEMPELPEAAREGSADLPQ